VRDHLPIAPRVLSPKDEAREIRSLDEWRDWAGPLYPKIQWKCGRSAKEVARAWLQPDGSARVPVALQDLLDSRNHGLVVETAIPELRTWLGDVPRGARRHDLVLLAHDAQGHPTLVGVEAKTDEPFDDLVRVRVARSHRDRAACAEEGRAYKSQQLPRLDRLTRALFGRPAFDPAGDLEAVIGELPYQLLAGAAGTLIEARRRGAEQAMFVVHALHSASLDRVKLAANDRGFARFTRLLLGEGGDAPQYGGLLGPVVPPGGDTIPPLPLWVGIAQTALSPYR
jgi:hypothetical protein